MLPSGRESAPPFTKCSITPLSISCWYTITLNRRLGSWWQLAVMFFGFTFDTLIFYEIWLIKFIEKQDFEYQLIAQYIGSTNLILGLLTYTLYNFNPSKGFASLKCDRGCPKKHRNSVTNSISSLYWISIVIPNFKSHNIIVSARV